MYDPMVVIQEMNHGFATVDGLGMPAFTSQEATMSMLEADGSIEPRTKILMCLSVIAYVRCPECLALHLSKAFKAGMKRQEILEACSLGIAFGGGPSMGFITTHVVPGIEAFEKLIERGEEIPEVKKFSK